MAAFTNCSRRSSGPKRMKRSLGPRIWIPKRAENGPQPKPKAAAGLIPLREGPAIGSSEALALPAEEPQPKEAEIPRVKAYGRGDQGTAIQFAKLQTQGCYSHIVKRARAENSHSAYKARENTCRRRSGWIRGPFPSYAGTPVYSYGGT